MNLSFERVMALLERHWKKLVFLFIFGASIGGTLAYMFGKYAADVSLLIEASDSDPLMALSAKVSGLSLKGFSDEDEAYRDKMLVFLDTRDFYEKIARRIQAEKDFQFFNESEQEDYEKYYNKEIKENPPEKIMTIEQFVADNLREFVQITKHTANRLNVSVTTRHQSLSANLANLIAEEATKTIRKIELNEIDQSRNYVDEKVDGLVARLTGINSEMASIRLKTPEVATNNQELFYRLAEVEASLQDTIISLNRNEQMLSQLKDESSPQGNGADVSYAWYHEKQLASLITKRSNRLAQGVDPTSREIVYIEQDIQEITERLNEYRMLTKSSAVLSDLDTGTNYESSIANLRSENSRLKALRGSTEKLLSQLEIRRDKNVEDLQQYYGLTKRLELEFSIYGQLVLNKFQLDIQRIAADNRTMIVEKASIFGIERSPGVGGGAFLGGWLVMFLTCLLIIFKDQTDPLVIFEEDIPSDRIQLIGVVPNFKKIKTVSFDDPIMHIKGSAVALEFSHIRNRMLRVVDPMKKTCVVASITSSWPSEGKSFTSIHLSFSLHSLGKKILLIDGDIRGRGTSRYLNMDERTGFSELILGKFPLEHVMHNFQNKISVIPCGAFVEDSNDLFKHQNFKSSISELKKRFDYIIVDCPPVMVMPEAVDLIYYAHFPIIVSSSFRSKRRVLDMAVSKLTTATENKIYGILNFAQKSSRTEITGAGKYNYYYNTNKRKVASGGNKSTDENNVQDKKIDVPVSIEEKMKSAS